MVSQAAVATGLRASALILWLVAAGCAADDGHPPVARASATPESIPEGDEFQTAVILDGSASADPIDDPEGLLDLEYHWEIWGDEHRFDQGTADSQAPVVRFRGNRPATVELTVTDADGQSHRVTFQMVLTLSP